MANDSSDYDALKRQLHGHLRSLRAAGVEWLPLGPPLDATPDAPTESEPELVRQLSLLDAAEPPAPALTLTIEQRRHALQLLAEEVRPCTKCAELCSTRTQTVFGQGEPGVELCFIGEAPGAD